jgi:hypothetical protein
MPALRFRRLDPPGLRVGAARFGDKFFLTSYLRRTIRIGQVVTFLTAHQLVYRSRRLEGFQLFERLNADRVRGLIRLRHMREQR